MCALLTDAAVGDPLTVRVIDDAVTLTGPAVPSEALAADTSVIDKVPPTHPLGMELSTTFVTTLACDVHDTVTALSVPHEPTDADPPATVLVDSVCGAAAAMVGASTALAATATTTGARIADQPVTTTDTPVTLPAVTLLLLKSGEAAPLASSVPVTSPSDALAAPVRVTR